MQFVQGERTMRRFLVAAMIVCAPGVANALNTWGTDMSDLWWNPNESGWGINIAHQREVIFATFFVYGADNKTRWYVAPDMIGPSSGDASSYTFSGNLYETNGPFLGGPFNPTQVSNVQVGTATLVFSQANRGTLDYSVGTSVVSKVIERQTFRRAEIRGTYAGAILGTTSGCGAAVDHLANGIFAVTLNPLPSNSITISSTLENGAQCNYSGNYEQQGRLGTIAGTFSCGGNVPTAGTFNAFEIEAGNGALVIRYEARYESCVERGRIGGLKP